MTKANINTKEKCLRVLFSFVNQIENCDLCDGDFFYLNDNYDCICSNCKKRFGIAKNTIFENVRFGIVKAFNIAYDLNTSERYLSSIAIAKKYGITQKTAYLFIQKVNSNKGFIRQLFDVKVKTKKDILNLDKLKKALLIQIKLKKALFHFL
jgi:hypothetical protein